MKIKKMRIVNFQSLKDLELSFDEKGIFRLRGLNNSGKSAVLKAITVLMRNVSNNNYRDYLRDGEDTFSISMEDFDGNKVILSRGSVDFYEWTINGNQDRLDKTKGKVPKKLKDYFNLYEENEKTKECLNIRLPREVLLFVDTSYGDNAMMFQKALGTEEYMLAIKKVDRKGRELNKEIELADKYLKREEEKLEKINGELHEKNNKLSDIERYEKALNKEYEDYKEVENLVEETEKYAKEQKEVADKNKVIEEMDFEGLEDDFKTFESITELTKEYDKRRNKEKELKDKKDKIKGMDIEGIQEDLDALKIIEDTLGIGEKVSSIQKNIKTNKKELKEIEKDIDECRNELGVCPLCGGSLTEEHTH